MRISDWSSDVCSSDRGALACFHHYSERVEGGPDVEEPACILIQILREPDGRDVVHELETISGGVVTADLAFTDLLRAQVNRLGIRFAPAVCRCQLCGIHRHVPERTSCVSGKSV